MKRLDELVKDEMVRRRVIVKNAAGEPIMHQVQLSPQQLTEIVQNTEQKQAQARDRLQNDPALAMLIEQSLAIVSMVASLQAPDFAKKNSMAQILVETIEIWETANNRYNEQLHGPTPPQSTTP